MCSIELSLVLKRIFLGENEGSRSRDLLSTPRRPSASRPEKSVLYFELLNLFSQGRNSSESRKCMPTAMRPWAVWTGRTPRARRITSASGDRSSRSMAFACFILSAATELPTPWRALAALSSSMCSLRESHNDFSAAEATIWPWAKKFGTTFIKDRCGRDSLHQADFVGS